MFITIARVNQQMNMKVKDGICLGFCLASFAICSYLTLHPTKHLQITDNSLSFLNIVFCCAFVEGSDITASEPQIVNVSIVRGFVIGQRVDLWRQVTVDLGGLADHGSLNLVVGGCIRLLQLKVRVNLFSVCCLTSWRQSVCCWP